MAVLNAISLVQKVIVEPRDRTHVPAFEASPNHTRLSMIQEPKSEGPIVAGKPSLSLKSLANFAEETQSNTDSYPVKLLPN